MFIRGLPIAWRTHKDEHTAQQEEEHIELWAKFAESLGVSISTAERPNVRHLVMVARELYWYNACETMCQTLWKALDDFLTFQTSHLGISLGLCDHL